MNGQTGIGGKLVAVAAVSLLIGYFIGREHLKYERHGQGVIAGQILQVTVTRGISQEVRLYLRSINSQADSLVRFLESIGALENVADRKYANTLDNEIEGFVGTGEEVLYLTILNAEQRGRQGGVTALGRDEVVIQKLGEAFQTAQLGHAYNSAAFLASPGAATVPVMVMARPLVAGNDFRGMVATVVNLKFLRQRLVEASEGGLVAYVVDKEGYLVVHPDDKEHVVGQDMSNVGIVQMFLAGTRQATTTVHFELEENGKTVKMLGTCAPVPELDWAVIAQEPAGR